MEMAKVLIVRCVLFGLLVLPFACVSNADNNGDATSVDKCGVQLTMDVQGSTSVAGMRFELTPVACETGSPMGDLMVITKDLEDMVIPGGITDLPQSPFYADSTHQFADAFITLTPGCYLIKTTPIDSFGNPSQDCASAQLPSVKVVSGKTTEVFAVNQCSSIDNGAVDVVSAINHSPKISTVAFEGSKFVKQCAPQVVCATASDADNDPLEWEWTVADEPPHSEPEVVSTVTNDDKSITQCVKVIPLVAGHYEFELTVYDLVTVVGVPVRYEEWLADQGYPNDSHSSLTFPFYAVQSEEAGQGVAEVCNGIDDDCDGETDEGLTFDVDGDGYSSPQSCDGSADDCDDNDPNAHPGASETCDDGVDNDCDLCVDEADCVHVSEGQSVHGKLISMWTHPLFEGGGNYGWGYFGSSPGIADFGSDVGEGNKRLEIVTGSDAFDYRESDIGATVVGAWHMFNHDGKTLWAKDTQSDESRGSVAIADFNNDSNLEIGGGTTSGRTLEVMDRHGNWVWTFPTPPEPGAFSWPGGMAVVEVNPVVNGLEVFAGNRDDNRVYSFDGDNSDGVNEGCSVSGWAGNEGTDWDVLWRFDLGLFGKLYASPAVGDIDADGTKEVVIGSTNGRLVALNAVNGALEWSFHTVGGIFGSAALADFDGDGDLEIVIGASDHMVYFIDGDENKNGVIDHDEYTVAWTNGAVYSSASIGDLDHDGDLETVIGSNDGILRSYHYNPSDDSVAVNWSRNLGGDIYSSPSLANRHSSAPYRIEWGQFRRNNERTGFYGNTSDKLDVYVGSNNGYMNLLDGSSGTLIDRFFVGYQYTGVPNEIRTSPSIADVDGDGVLEVFFYEWGTEDTFWAIKDIGSKTVTVRH